VICLLRSTVRVMSAAIDVLATLYVFSGPLNLEIYNSCRAGSALASNNGAVAKPRGLDELLPCASRYNCSRFWSLGVIPTKELGHHCGECGVQHYSARGLQPCTLPTSLTRLGFPPNTGLKALDAEGSGGGFSSRSGSLWRPQASFNTLPLGWNMLS
jgi:hypothetical protein